MTLTEANAAAHEVLEGLLFDTIEAAVDGRVTEARSALATLQRAFAMHLSVEEAYTLPILRDLGGPLVKLALIVDGDHRIVDRSLAGVAELLSSVGEDGPEARRAVLQKLEVLTKLKTVLEHHGVREQEDIYPPLDARFPDQPWASDLVPRDA